MGRLADIDSRVSKIEDNIILFIAGSNKRFLVMYVGVGLLGWFLGSSENREGVGGEIYVTLVYIWTGAITLFARALGLPLLWLKYIWWIVWTVFYFLCLLIAIPALAKLLWFMTER